jgi:hypothetical protein
MPSVESILRSYPRVRPDLPKAHQEVYEREYKLNRDGEAAVEGLAKKLEGWMHGKVADQKGGPLLELGAGTLNHLRWENGTSPYDVVEPFEALYKDSPMLESVRNVYGSVQDIPAENRYQRIVSVAVLEHMTDLPGDVAKAGLLMERDGVFQAGIPSEGGFLWWLGWRMTTGLTYWFRNRLDYGEMMRHEHVNTAPDIISVVKYFFEEVRLARFPVPAHHLSLYGYLEARKPKLDLCEKLLESRKES